MLLRGVLFSHEYINELFTIVYAELAFFYNSLPFAVYFLLPAPFYHTWYSRMAKAPEVHVNAGRLI